MPSLKTAEKQQEQRPVAADRSSRVEHREQQTLELVDRRPQAVAQRKLMDLFEGSRRSSSLSKLQARMNEGSRGQDFVQLQRKLDQRLQPVQLVHPAFNSFNFWRQGFDGEAHPMSPEGQLKRMTALYGAEIAHELLHTEVDEEDAFERERIIADFLSSNGDSPAAREKALRALKNVKTTNKFLNDVMDQDLSGSSVETRGGTWTAVDYELKPGITNPTARGAWMKLVFLPRYGAASATKIALVQSVRGIKNGEPYFLGDETIAARSTESGTSIDQAPDSTSPFYADGGGGGHGFLYEDRSDWEGKSKWSVEHAWLQDLPHLSGVQGPSEQVLDVTALAVEGRDEGMYYGTVRWGWKVDEKGKHTLLPLTVVSHGDPSPEFIAAAKRWNVTPTSEDKEPQQLPIPEK